MTETVSSEDARILKSLLSWWEEVGIEVPAIPTAARQAKPAAQPAQSGPARQTVAAARTATPSQARAAGFAARPTDEDGLALAGSAGTLDELRQALGAFEGCGLKTTATRLVFGRGNPDAELMIVGDAPSREDDEQGLPFSGKPGLLLQRMLAAIGLDEDRYYITHAVNWRPPGNRKPTQDEVEACRPFAERHIALVKPKLLLLAGGVSAQTLLRAKDGIVLLRGRWTEYRLKDAAGEEAGTVPALPVFNPGYLLLRPQEKAKAWQDMLSLQDRLEPG